MRKIKWSGRQSHAIRKVIRHYKRILKEDNSNGYLKILVEGSCPFCDMYVCGLLSKCPNAVLQRDCCPDRPIYTTVSYASLDRILEEYKKCPPEDMKIVYLRNAIKNRISYWQRELKRGEV